MRGSPPAASRHSRTRDTLNNRRLTPRNMSERFTETQMLKLAEIYRDYDCLWDANSDLYKDRAARDAAYQKIRERLKIPGLSVKDVPKKIKNLRSSYYQEIKRIQNSRRSGAGEDSVYKPKVSWFTTVEGYLKPFRNKRETYSYNYKDSNSASDSELETQNTKIEDVTITEEDLSLAEEESNAAVNWSSTRQTSISVQTEQNENSPTYFILPSSKQVKREDEFDTFAKYIATALRSLPKELAIVGQTDIQKVISEMQLRALRQSCDPLLPHSTIKLEDE